MHYFAQNYLTKLNRSAKSHAAIQVHTGKRGCIAPAVD